MESDDNKYQDNYFSVFVGHISFLTTEEELIDLFQEYGKIENVYMCSGSSSGYRSGFVRYKHIESVFEAIEQLNGYLLKGSKIIVDIARDTLNKLEDIKTDIADKHISRNKVAETSDNNFSVFVGCIHPSTTEKDLFDLFQEYGEIESVFICNNSSLNTHYGLVCYKHIGSVFEAIDQLNGYSLKGGKIIVDVAKSTMNRINKIKTNISNKILYNEAEPSNNNFSVFVGRIPLSTTEEELLSLFQEYGKVENVSICDVFPANKKYGFVHYKHIESVIEAREQLNGYSLKGNKIIVEVAKDTLNKIKTIKAKTSTVFVGNIHSSTTEEELLNLFQEYGKIENVSFCNDSPTEKCCGIVRYKRIEPAFEAVEQLNGYSFKGNKIIVDLDKDIYNMKKK